jgi:hypothetical protein
MFKRLVFLLMLIAATVAVSPPAHAATLTVTWICEDFWLGDEPYPFFFQCTATASGGTGPYTYRWYRNSSLIKTETTTGSSTWGKKCSNSYYAYSLQVIVTDSQGAVAGTPRETFYCSS